MQLHSEISHELDTRVFKSFCKTDIGLCRGDNQDSYGSIETPYFKIYIVADGMGGTKGGAIASSLAVNTIKEFFKNKYEITEQLLVESIELANKKIFKLASSDITLLGMGTTIAVLGFSGSKVLVANVGDSRIYKLSKNGFQQLTEDHTVVAEFVKSGLINTEQAKSNNMSHILTRSLGPSNEVSVDYWLSPDAPTHGEKYLICSDGLYSTVDEFDIKNILHNFPVEIAVDKLVTLANENGGHDNITAIGVAVSDNFSISVEDTVPFFIAPSNSENPENGKTLSVDSHFYESYKSADNVDSIRVEELQVAPSENAAVQSPEYTKDSSVTGDLNKTVMDKLSDFTFIDLVIFSGVLIGFIFMWLVFLKSL